MQWALAWPVIMLLVVGTVQSAVVLQARSAVSEAARAGVRAQALHDARPGDAEVAAGQVLVGSGVTRMSVKVGHRGNLVRVEVSGAAPTFLSDLPLTRVSAHAVAVKEGS